MSVKVARAVLEHPPATPSNLLEAREDTGRTREESREKLKIALQLSIGEHSLPWIGLGADCIKEEEFENYLTNYGYSFSKKFEIEVLVESSWTRFKVYEVLGFVEGVADILAEAFRCPALESGPHLVLGEVSAKLWDEAVKVVFPNGETHVIPVYTYDGFLDIRMPTSKVKGLKGQMIVGGKVFDLPITEEDFQRIVLLDKRVREKLEKAIAIYGVEKILEKKLLDKLREEKTRGIKEQKITYEIDPESGIVLCIIDGKLTSMSLARFAVLLAQREMYSELEKFISNLAPEQRREVKKHLEEFLLIFKDSLKSPSDLKKILEKIG
ncbi:hypothetical protein [Infirmifilum sp. SLHALR2]|nr:MAG: hypothetical protein B7L53_06895 [Thermofilum sp. NZ13]